MKKILIGSFCMLSTGLWGMTSGVAIPSSSYLKVPPREDIGPAIVYRTQGKKRFTHISY